MRACSMMPQPTCPRIGSLSSCGEPRASVRPATNAVRDGRKWTIRPSGKVPGRRRRTACSWRRCGIGRPGMLLRHGWRSVRLIPCRVDGSILSASRKMAVSWCLSLVQRVFAYPTYRSMQTRLGLRRSCSALGRSCQPQSAGPWIRVYIPMAFIFLPMDVPLDSLASIGWTTVSCTE